jgi:hypothetical protein
MHLSRGYITKIDKGLVAAKKKKKKKNLAVILNGLHTKMN